MSSDPKNRFVHYDIDNEEIMEPLANFTVSSSITTGEVNLVSLDFVQQAANPGDASQVWQRSSDHHLMRGAIDLEPSTGVTVGGPASSTDNAVVRWDGTGGNTVQNSTVIVSDTGDVTVPSGGALKIWDFNAAASGTPISELQTAVGTGQKNLSVGFSNGLAYDPGVSNNIINNTLIGYSNCGSGAVVNNFANNTVVGEGNMAAATSASQNTCVGVINMPLATTAASCVAVGNQVMDLVTTGTNLVGLGFQAGRACANNTSNATFIGANALGTTHTARTADNVVAVGAAALGSPGASVADCTAVGTGALAVCQATSLTAVGRNALASNTTGAQNTALGYSALANNTTAAGNTAVGYNALVLNTGASNTAVGSGALATITSNASCTAVGTNALTSTTGGFNTAVGHGAGGGNSTGTNNTYVGQGAGAVLTSGGSNTVVGMSAGVLLDTPSNTTVVGANAFAAATTNPGASSATIVGKSAAAGVTSGNAMTAVGANTPGSSVTTAIGSTFLGSVLCNSASSYTNCIVIDSTGGCSAGTPAMTNNIMIGTLATNDTGTTSNIIRLGNGSHNKTFIRGIRGVTTVNADAVAVLVDSASQLGTVSSALEFKEDVIPLDQYDDSEWIHKLRPVSFRYKTHPEHKRSVGLIADEVEALGNLAALDMCVYDADTQKIFTLQYDRLVPFLLREIQKLKEAVSVLSPQPVQAKAAPKRKAATPAPDEGEPKRVKK